MYFGTRSQDPEERLKEFHHSFLLEDEAYDAQFKVFRYVNRYIEQTSHFSGPQLDHPAFEVVREMGLSALPYIVDYLNSETSHDWITFFRFVTGSENLPSYSEEYRGKARIIGPIYREWALNGPGVELVYRGLAEQLDKFSEKFEHDYAWMLQNHQAYDRILNLGGSCVKYLIEDLRATFNPRSPWSGKYWRANAISRKVMPNFPNRPVVEIGDVSSVKILLEWAEKNCKSH